MSKFSLFPLALLLLSTSLSAQQVINESVRVLGNRYASFVWQHRLTSGGNKDYFRFLSDRNENKLLLQYLNQGNWRNALVVDKATGYLGIGTASPGQPLTIQGTGTAYMNLRAGNQTLLIGADGAGGIVSTVSNHDLQLRAGGNRTRLTIKASGNVGIGTSNPGSYRLAVEGKIGAREVEIKTSSWADFVFADDYALPSLEEVDAYVRQNHHLPDMPSEAEVLAKGSVSVGAMQKLLLQKIEELTLYTIAQQRQIEALQTEVAKLKK